MIKKILIALLGFVFLFSALVAVVLILHEKQQEKLRRQIQVEIQKQNF